jgi:hypothetical protein
MFSVPSEAAFFWPVLGSSGFLDQVGELRQSIRRPTHTIIFKFFEYIWCILSCVASNLKKISYPGLLAG